MSTSFSNSQANGVVIADGFQGPSGPASFPSGVTQGAANYTAYAAGGQANATPLTEPYANVNVVAAANASVLLTAAVGGQEQIVSNNGANNLDVYPAVTNTINGGAAGAPVIIPPGEVVSFLSTVAGAWITLGPIEDGGSALPSASYSTSATAPVSNNVALTPAQVTGGVTSVTFNYTGAASAGYTFTTPTAAQIVAAIPDAQVGHSYVLSILNTGSGQTGTVTGGTGVTVNGTATIGNNTGREFIVTLTSLTAVTLQNIGGWTLL